MKRHFPLPKSLIFLIILLSSLTISNYALACEGLSLTADPIYIPANGTSTSTLTAKLSIAYAPPGDYRVYFFLMSGCAGKISPASAVTDSAGYATSTYISSTIPAPVWIRAQTTINIPIERGGGTRTLITDWVCVYVVKVTQNYPLWWFNGEDAANYNEIITLTAEGTTTGTFSWTVTSGTDKVNLENDQDSITLTNDNTVNVKSTGASAIPSDVGIKLSINGVYVTTHTLSVYTPNLTELIPGYPVDIPFGIGFQTEYQLKVKDQFGNVIPYDLAENEDFGPTTSDFPGGKEDTWSDPPFTAGGGTISDGISIDYYAIDATPGAIYPDPVNPGSPGNDTTVQHGLQFYRAGSSTVGKGQLYKAHKLQWYRGKARQE